MPDHYVSYRQPRAGAKLERDQIATRFVEINCYPRFVTADTRAFCDGEMKAENPMVDGPFFAQLSHSTSTGHSSSSLANVRLCTSGLLSPDEFYALQDAALPPTSISAGTNLTREGERAEHVLIVAKGWVCRYLTTRGGGRQITGLSLPGEVCNLDALMFEHLDYGIRTLTETTFVALPRLQALALAQKHAGIASALTWSAFVDNAILTRSVLSLGRRSAKERLGHLLCELSVRLAVDNTDASSFTFLLTQETVADLLGLTAVHVNRMMRQLSIEGLIKPGDRTMSLPDMAALRRIAGFDPSYLHVDPQDKISKGKCDE